MVTLSAGSWRARRLSGADAARPRLAEPDPVGASARRQRRTARAQRAGAAAAASDRFLDVVVLLSVVVFLVLALGVGMLVLQSALPR
jgi:hypothetical protein